jgi:hypothetical protein
MTERDLSKILTPLEPGSKAQTARALAECLRVAKELVFVGQDGQEGSIANELLELMAEALDRFADQQARGDLTDTHKYTIEVSKLLGAQLSRLAKRCTAVHKERDGATTHGALTVECLLEMLAEDCGMVISRPGSWEGSGMANLLASHGYDLGE